MRLIGTKKFLEERMRTIVRGAKIGLPLDGRDAIDALSVLRRHPDWKHKRGKSIDYICVKVNHGSYGKTKGFWLKRNDGTFIDVSWVYALRNSTHERNVKNAARVIVADQIKAFRQYCISESGKVTCENCRKKIPACNSDVHHVVPFVTLFNEWLHHENIAISEIKLIHVDKLNADAFENEELAERWRELHGRLCVLQLLCDDCHKIVTHK